MIVLYSTDVLQRAAAGPGEGGAVLPLHGADPDLHGLRLAAVHLLLRAQPASWLGHLPLPRRSLSDAGRSSSRSGKPLPFLFVMFGALDVLRASVAIALVSGAILGAAAADGADPLPHRRLQEGDRKAAGRK